MVYIVWIIVWRYLISTTTTARPRNINDVMPMIGARFYSQLDATHLRNDVLEHALSRVSLCVCMRVCVSVHGCECVCGCAWV